MITPILDGKFVRVDYTWQYQGTPQQGSILWGYDTELAIATAYWIDSWHMGDKGMLCQGEVTEDGVLSVRGEYDVGEGPAWGWRISVIQPDGTSLQMIMNNISPDGQEELAVEATYTQQVA